MTTTECWGERGEKAGRGATWGLVCPCLNFKVCFPLIFCKKKSNLQNSGPWRKAEFQPTLLLLDLLSRSMEIPSFIYFGIYNILKMSNTTLTLWRVVCWTHELDYTCSLFDLTRLSYNAIAIICLATLLPPQTKIFYRQRRGRGSHGGRFTQAPTNWLLLLREIQMLSLTPTMDTSSENPVSSKTRMTCYWSRLKWLLQFVPNISFDCWNIEMLLWVNFYCCILPLVLSERAWY